MPQTALSLPGLFMAGDWLAQGPGTHGAKGLSQEKAWVTGLQAGNQVGIYCCLAAAFSDVCQQISWQMLRQVQYN